MRTKTITVNTFIGQMLSFTFKGQLFSFNARRVQWPTAAHLQNNALAVSLPYTRLDSVHDCLQSTLNVWTICLSVRCQSRGFAHRQFERPNQFNGTTPVKRCNRLLMRIFNIYVSSAASIRTLCSCTKIWNVLLVEHILTLRP